MAVNVDINYSGKFNLPIPIHRLNQVPIDTTSIWDTKANAEAYAAGTESTAYVGQILFVQADNKLYKIKDTDGHLEELGSGKAGFLSYWDCSTGLATDTFADLPYTYKKGDYFRAIPNPNAGKYKHTIYLLDQGYWSPFYIYIYNDSSTPFTYETLRVWLRENGYQCQIEPYTYYTNVSGYYEVSAGVHDNWNGAAYGYYVCGSTVGGRLIDTRNTWFQSDTVTVVPHYIPSGSTYTGVASTTELIQTLTNDAMFVYNGSTWSVVDQAVYSLPTASASTLGGIKIGSGLAISNGVASVIFPTASSSTLGLVKQGTNISIASDGTISGAYSVFNSSSNGLVPQGPESQQTQYYLRGDGTWSTVIAESVAPATSSTVGGILSQTTGTTANRDYVIEVDNTGKAKVNVPWTDTLYTLPPATTNQLGGIIVGSHLSIDENGVLSAEAGAYTLPIASGSTLGGIKVGNNLVINASTGVLSAVNTTYSVFTSTTNGLVPKATDASLKFLRGDGTWQEIQVSLPIATASVLGGIKVGSNLTITEDGVLSADASPYTLPIASTTILGGIKIGTNLNIDTNGVVSATDTTYNIFTSSTNGLVPKSSASGDDQKFLRGDGSWQAPTFSIPIASASTIGGIKIGSNLDFQEDGTLNGYVLPIATGSTLGGIKVGTGLSIDENGILNSTYSIPIASASTLGGVKIGDNISVTPSGIISVAVFTGATNGLVPAYTGSAATDKVLNCQGDWVQIYTPTIATSSEAGVIKIGRGTTIDTNGVLNLNIANSSTLGGVKIGNGLNVTADGTVSTNIPYASENTAGLVKIGANIFIDGNGVISSTDTIYDVFTTQLDGLVPKASNSGDTGKFLRGDGTWQTVSANIPTASSTTLGGIKIGNNLSIDANGIASATDTTYSTFTSSNSGLVPAATDASNKYLRGDGTWQTVSSGISNPGFLSFWDCSTGLATDTFADLPYTYKKGDYFRAIPKVIYRHTISLNILQYQEDVILIIESESNTPMTMSDIATWLYNNNYQLETSAYTNISGTYEGDQILGCWARTLTRFGVKTTTQSPLMQISSVEVESDTVTKTQTYLTPNLIPSGNSYTGTASTTQYDGWLDDKSVFCYNGSEWIIDALSIASSSVLGGIKIGNNLSIDANGVASATDTTYSTFTTSTAGLVPAATDASSKYLRGDGTWQTPTADLPIASSTTLGGIKIGNNLQIDANGVASATDTTYSVFSTTANGLVPIASDVTKYLKGDGTWSSPISAAADIPGVSYSTVAPTSANTDGLKIVILSSEPATKYDGWLYIITS